ncbi:MAG: hypothetical protein ACI9LM_004178 [Alteromonadaceae bacterium]
MISISKENNSKINEIQLNTLTLNTILIFAIVFLLSCTSPEHSKALENYDKAKHNHSLPSLIQALKILVKFEPDDYKSELTKNLQLAESLAQAKKYMADENYYQSYLNSHDVYRQSLDRKSKALLIASGQKLTPIIKAQNNIESFFNNRPKHLSKILTKFAMSPVISWNLIEVNQLINQLSENKRDLQSALLSLSNDNYVLEIPEINQWIKGIEAQLANINHAQNSIINRARHQSATALLDIHKSLTKESIRLLSYVNSKLAIETLAPTFAKATETYNPYKVLIENISLALLLSRADIHVSWYKHWVSIENNVLQPIEPFSNYPKDAKNINLQLNQLINENISALSSLRSDSNNLAEFSDQYPKINILIKKLKRDKALI